MSEADPSLTTPAPASGKNPASAPVTPAENAPLILDQNQVGDDTAAPTHPKTRHHGHRAKHAALQHSGSRPREKTWRETVDHGLEIIICIGHIVGATMLVAEHLF